jgi:hypothetical protein
MFPVVIEVGIPLTHRQVDPHHRELPGHLVELMHCCGLDIFVGLESMAL